LGKTIHEKFGKVKEDIIDFVSLGAPGLNSHQLRDLCRQAKNNTLNLSDLRKFVRPAAPSINFLKTASHHGAGNAVVEGIRSTNFRFFQKNIMERPTVASIHGTVNHTPTQSININSPGYVTPKEGSRAMSTHTGKPPVGHEPELPDEEVIEHIQELYTGDPEPVIQSHAYRVIELLLRYYDLEVKQGAMMSDETSKRNHLVMELAALQGKDPSKLVRGNLALKEEIQVTLNKILKSNSYKLMDIEVNPDFKPHQEYDDIGEEDRGEGKLIDDLGQIQELKSRIVQNSSRQHIHVQNSSDKDEIEDTPRLQEEIAMGTDDKPKQGDKIIKNIRAVLDAKSVLKEIDKANPPLVSQNIPFLSNETGFTRGEMHTFYTLYKALCYATSQRNKDNEDYKVDDGIDKPTFRKGVYQVFIQSDMLASSIFDTIDYNFSSFMNWPEFISGMQMIKAKTLADKVQLFIKVTFLLKVVS